MLEKEPKQGKKFQYLRIYNLEKIWSRIHQVFGPEFTWSQKYLVPNSFFYVLSRARYPSSHVCTSSAVFIGFMYILKVCSFIHLFNPPPVGTRGSKLEYVLRIPMRLEWGGFSE